MTVGGMSIAFVVVMAVLFIILVGLIIGIIKVSIDLKKEKEAKKVADKPEEPVQENVADKPEEPVQENVADKAEEPVQENIVDETNEVEVKEEAEPVVDTIEPVEEVQVEETQAEDVQVEEVNANADLAVSNDEAIDNAYNELLNNTNTEEVEVVSEPAEEIKLVEEINEDITDAELDDLIIEDSVTEVEEPEKVLEPVVHELKANENVYQPVVRKLEPIKKDTPVARNRKVNQQDFFTPIKLTDDKDKKVKEEKVEEVKVEVEPAKEPVAEKKPRRKATRVVKDDEKADTKNAKKQPKEMYVLTYDKNDRLWVIKKSTNTRATKKFVTKEEALKELKVLAEKAGIPYLVQKMDGKFQKI